MDKKGFTGGFQIIFDNDSVVINPKKQHKYTLIWLHGLNQQPSKFLKLFLESPLVDVIDDIKIVIPSAPFRPTTIYDGKRCVSWYDVLDRSQQTFQIPFDQAFNQNDIIDSTKIIEKIVEEELKFVDEKHLLIGGFSQGCAMALQVAFSFNKNWAGVIAIAGYLFEITPYRKETTFPIKIFHGTSDRGRPWEHIGISYDRQGAEVTMIEGMDHDYESPELRRQIRDFILIIKSQ